MTKSKLTGPGAVLPVVDGTLPGVYCSHRLVSLIEGALTQKTMPSEIHSATFISVAPANLLSPLGPRGAMHPALRCSDTFATCGPSSMQASGRRALRAPGRGWAYKGSTHPATMALALGGLLGLLAFMLCPTEAVVGKHNCPLDCNGHGLCSMTEDMKCTVGTV